MVFAELASYFHCAFEDFVGSGGDGGKWICDPHRVNRPGCLVYSIGSNGKFDFEVHVQRVLPQCEIHIFDFDNFTEQMIELGATKGHFHRWGIKSSGGDINIATNLRKGNTFKSFAETIKELGHQGRLIDILKVDCENCEWLSYMDWFDNPGITGIRQIAIETRYTPPKTTKRFFQYLHDKGYIIFHKEPNNEWGRGECVEFSLLLLDKEAFASHPPVDPCGV